MKFDYYESGKWVKGFETVDDAVALLWPIKKGFWSRDLNDKFRQRAQRELQLCGTTHRGRNHVKQNTIRTENFRICSYQSDRRFTHKKER